MPAKQSPQENGPLAQVIRPGQQNFLCFDGNSANFDLWFERAVIYLKRNYPEQAKCAMVEKEEDKSKIANFEDHNYELYEFLVLFLDPETAKLVMLEARGDGVEAIKAIKHHHLGSVHDNGMLAMMNLVSITKESEETLTDYQIRLKALVKTVE